MTRGRGWVRDLTPAEYTTTTAEAAHPDLTPTEQEGGIRPGG